MSQQPKIKMAEIPTADLIPNPRNAKQHDDAQVSKIAGSIKEFGFGAPIITDGENGILAGHGRWLAAQKLGLEKVPCVEMGHLSDTQRRAYMLADNRLAEIGGGWDMDALKIELEELSAEEIDLDALGFGDEFEIDLDDGGEVAEDVDAEPQTDDVPEPPANPVTVQGDIWKLGNHRLLCGDCRSHSDVEKVLAGRKINVAVTSPPYASQRKYDESSEFKPIPPDEYVEWYSDVAANIMSNLADDGSYFCNIKEHCDDGQRSLYVKDLTLAHAREWGWRFVDELIWKHEGIPGRWPNRLKNTWEPCFHFCVSDKIKLNHASISHASDRAGKYTGEDGTTSCGNTGFSGEVSGGMALPGNCIEINHGVGRCDDAKHPAKFPVALPEFFIKAFSDSGDMIFDPFMGSGTTMIAAEKNGRHSCGTEISPMYCDVIIKRWQDFTGQQATHEASGQTFDELKAAK